MIFELAVSIVSAYCEKQWLLASVCLVMKVINIGTVSGLKRDLCKAFGMQDINGALWIDVCV